MAGYNEFHATLNSRVFEMNWFPSRGNQFHSAGNRFLSESGSLVSE